MNDPKQPKAKPEETTSKPRENDAYLPSREDEGYVEPEQQDGMAPEDLDSDDQKV